MREAVCSLAAQEECTEQRLQKHTAHFLGSKASELCKGGDVRRAVGVGIVNNGINATSVTNGDPSNASYAPAVPTSQPPRSTRNSNVSFMSYHTAAAPLRCVSWFSEGLSISARARETSSHRLLSIDLLFSLAGRRGRTKAFSDRFSQKTFISTFQHRKYLNSPFWTDRFYILCITTSYCFTLNISRKGAGVYRLVAP